MGVDNKTRSLIFIVMSLTLAKFLLYFIGTFSDEIKIVINYIYLILILIVIVAIIIKQYETIKNFFSFVDRKTMIFLLLIVILSFSLRINFITEPEWSGEIEWEYKAVAKDIALLEIHEKYLGSYRTHPRGYPILMSSMYLGFGISDESTAIFNSIVGTFSVIIIFLLYYLIFENKTGALIAAFILGVLPQHILMSGVGEAEITAVLFMLLTLLLFWMFLKTKEYDFLYLAFLFFVYSINIRMDMIGFVLSFAAFILLKKSKFTMNRVVFMTILFFILLIPITVFFQNNIGFGFVTDVLNPFSSDLEGNPFSPQQEYSIFVNIQNFFEILLNPNMHPWIYFIFLPFAFMNHKKDIWLILIYLLNAFFIYGIVFSGIQNVDRYILLTYPALVLLLARGLDNLKELTNKFFRMRKTLILTVVMLILVSLTFAIRTESERVRTLSDIEELRLIEEYVDSESFVIMCAILPCQFEFSSERCLFPDLSVRRFLGDGQRVYYIKTPSEASFGGCDGSIINQNFNVDLVVSYKRIDIFEIIE